MTLKMHRVVAVILCALLRRFPHYAEHINQTEERKKMVGNWGIDNQHPTDEMVIWCKLQWRRKPANLFKSNRTKPEESAKGTIRFDRNGPCCYMCGLPCPTCAGDFQNNVGIDLDKVIMDYEQYTSTLLGSREIT